MLNTNTAPTVINVTQQSFYNEVIERSTILPVIVDFWAEWCGPCKMLGPVLERLANEYNGAFVLAKVDVDSNPGLSQQFGVQGIPAVKAFINGKIVNEFTGALPEPQVRKFIQQIIPSKADKLVQQGQSMEANNQTTAAITMYEAALAEQSDHYPAILSLGRVLLKEGKVDEALSYLEQIPQGLPERNHADALIATAEFQRYAAGYSEAELQANITANPKDLESRFALASLFAVEQRYQEALEAFLAIIKLDKTFNNDGARKAMLALFTILGDKHSLTSAYRRQLASALF